MDAAVDGDRASALYQVDVALAFHRGAHAARDPDLRRVVSVRQHVIGSWPLAAEFLLMLATVASSRNRTGGPIGRGLSPGRNPPLLAVIKVRRWPGPLGRVLAADAADGTAVMGS